MVKRIILVTASLGIGGLEKIVTKIANHYTEKGFETTILCLMDKKKTIFYELNAKTKIIYFDFKQKQKKILCVFKWLKFLKFYFKKINPDFVCAMTLKIGALCCLSKGKNNFRLVMREICDPKSKARNRFIDSILFFICRKLDGIIFQTNWEKRCYPSYLQSKGIVIPNPCYVPDFWFSENKTKTIVSTGRLLNFQKRHDVLINAFFIFWKKHQNYKLIVYGNGPDKEKDLRLVNKLGISQNIIFEPSCANVIERINTASLFVISSDFEGMSNSLLEAFCLGMPCISTDWPGVEDIIENGINGLIVKRNSPEELADAMAKVIDDIRFSQKIATNAKRKSPIFDFETIIVEYSKMIEGNI